jgi:hypothetical protein
MYTDSLTLIVLISDLARSEARRFGKIETLSRLLEQQQEGTRTWHDTYDMRRRFTLNKQPGFRLL